MSGRDVPTQEKALSVALSVIMVLSVVVIGMSGPAGAVVSQDEITFGSDTYDDNFEPGNLEVLILDGNDNIQDSFSANTTSQTINRTNGSTDDARVGNLTGNLNNTGKVIEFALNNATDSNSTVVVGPGEYNLTTDTPQSDQPAGPIEIDTTSASSVSVFAHNTTAPNRAEINTTTNLNNLTRVDDGSLNSLSVGIPSSGAPSDAGGFFFNSSQASTPGDALNVTNTADSFSLTFENNNVSVGSADGVVFNGQSTAPSVTVNSNTLTGVTSFVNITGVVDNATVSGSITGTGSETGLNFTNSSSNLTVNALSLNQLGDGINVTDADTSVDLSDVNTDTTTNGFVASNSSSSFAVTVTGSSSFSNDTTAINASHNGNITVDSTTVITDSAVGINLNSTGNFANLNPTVNNATSIGVNVSQAATNITISSATFDGSNATNDLGLNFTTDAFASNLSVGSSTSFSNLDNAGIQLNNASAGEVTIDGATFADSTGDGINATNSFGNNTAISDATFSNVSTGVNIDSVTNEFNLSAEFNEFTNNNKGLSVDDSNANDINATFNDFISNTEALNVTNTNQAVNASYSFFGTTSGPGGATADNSVVDSNGVVIPKGSSDVTFTPFLDESVDTLSPSSQSVLVITDNRNPFAQPNTANVGSADNQLENATVAAVVLDDGTARSANGLSDITLIDNNVNNSEVDQGSLSSNNLLKNAGVRQDISANVTGDIEFRAVSNGNAAPAEFNQTFSNDVDSVEVELNRSSLPAGQVATATITLFDQSGEVINNTGTPVGFSFTPSDDITVINQDSITRGGSASVEFTTNAPGQDISIQGFENKNGNSASDSFGTETGAVSVGNSNLLFDGTRVTGSNADKALAQAGSEFDLDAVIQDSSGNALEDVEVTFDQNSSAVFGAGTTLTTDANGVVNNTVTVPEDASVDTEISVSAGDFNTENTNTANVNVTTGAATASQLGFAADNIVVPAGESTTIEVQIQDEFGNHNTSINNGDISLSSADTDIISVESSPVSVTQNGNATFTVNATAQSGSANLTATRSGVSDTTATASIGTPQDIQITVDNSSIASGVDNATDVTDVTAQFVDANGNAIGIGDSEIRFTRENGDAARVNSSAAISSDSSGAATFEAIATSQTGDTTFQLSSPEFGVSNTTTITTTGAPDTIGFSPNVSSPAVNDTIDLTVTVEDSQNRVVPVTASNYFDMSVTSDNGSFVESDTVRDASDGEGSINVTSSTAADVVVDAFISAEALNDDTTITVEEAVDEQPPTATVTFGENDALTVQNGSTSVNVASATFNGSEAFNIVVHQASDDNDDGTIQASEIGQKIGESVELDNGTQTDIPVNISKQVADNDNVSQLTENQTLVAMLHTTNTSDNDNIVHTASIKRDGTRVFDQAEITIAPESPLEGAPGEFDTDGNGDIDIRELGDAGQAFLDDELTIQELGEIGQEFLS